MNLPVLYQITSNDILPFTLENISNTSKKELMNKCSFFNHNKIKWGDAIQIDGNYRNNNKFFWNEGWKKISTDYKGPYFDYGILPHEFSVIDKQLPLNLFNKIIDYNQNVFPWTPKLKSIEITKNTGFIEDKFSTYFVHNNIKIIINSSLTTLDDKILYGLEEVSVYSYTKYNKPRNDTNVRINIKPTDNYILPNFLKPYIRKIYRYNTEEKLSKKIILKKKNYNKLLNNDIIVLKTHKKTLDKICNDYLIHKLTNSKYFNEYKSKFINNILNSKYLIIDDGFESTDEESIINYVRYASYY